MKTIILICLYLMCAQQIFAQNNISPFSAKNKQAPVHLAKMGTQPIHFQGSQSPMLPLSYDPVRSIPGSPGDYVWQAKNQISLPVQIRAYSEKGLPVFLKMQNQVGSRQAIANPDDALAAAHTQLKAIKGLLKLDDPEEEFVLISFESDTLGFKHVKLAQTYRHIAVYGSEMVVHFTPGAEVLINGRYEPTPKISNVLPAVESQAAIAIAMKDVAVNTPVVELNEVEKRIIKAPEAVAELVIYTVPGYIRRQRLGWHITLRPNFIKRWEYFVDAQNGEILHAYDHTCSIGPATATGQDLNGVTRTIGTFDEGNTFVLLDASKNMYSGTVNASPKNGDGFILTADLNNTSLKDPMYNEISSPTNTWTANAISAHYNASVAYDYFLNTHGHNSINGEKGDIISFINVADDDGGALDNAFWNGAAMFYGNGGTAFTPLAGGLDVGGHEMGHGVIQSLANLDYEGQSGALNESFADIFGVMIDRDDWALGEDIIPNTNFFPTGKMRDMANPHNGYPAGSNPLTTNGYQPAHLSELYTGNEDNGGVHINSGIPNKAFYLFATATSKSTGEKVFFRALKFYLTRSSQFIDCRLAVEQSAADLYGSNSAQVIAVRNAFDQVGILNGNATPPPPVLPANPGQEFIVSTDINEADPNTLYISNPDPGNPNYQALSQTEHLQKISVLDDGSEGIFVGADHDMYALFMNPGNTSETKITNDQFWDNVAVSPDGSKLAAVSINIDTAIYVYSFAQSVWAKYTLYSPTTAQGVKVGDVLYADAISWDLSGQYVLYDAFNRIPSLGGSDIEYWDVGFIRVWDNSINDFGSGVVTQLFTNLGEGVSIGNAVFSKNSPNIIAFDYFNESASESFLMAANLETGDVDVIFQNVSDILGYPSYSTDDDKIIFNAQTTSAEDVVAVIDLAPNKISPANGAVATVIVPDAKWGVWFATGSRDINIGVEALRDHGNSIQVFPNPFMGELNIGMELIKPVEISASVYDLMGREVKILLKNSIYQSGKQNLHFELGDLSAGAYLLRLRIGQQLRLVRVIKQ